MSYLHNEDGYLLIFYRVDNTVIAHSNPVVIILVAAWHIEVLQLLMAMWFWLLCQILYFFEYSVLHLGRNAF
ncbi:hypothetical protein SAMN05216167_1588 [Spirosoma endophyticum]|uniref:Uncharacterized protein n=1 Tax=Spirosoma endophyticum TaxID=662367 RepID=A0A1I2I6B7_9BACT|nr:hypothetical protein SAMN05216167_1588 [Spirosoma endophyticum]